MVNADELVSSIVQGERSHAQQLERAITMDAPARANPARFKWGLRFSLAVISVIA